MHLHQLAPCLLAAATTAQISLQAPLSAPRDVLDAFELRDGTVQELLLPRTGRMDFEVRVQLGDHVHTLALTPASIRAANFRVLVTDATGTRPAPAPVETTYRGSVLGVDGSVVAASLANGQLEAHVRTPQGQWVIQPLAKVMAAAPRHLHVAYRDADVLRSAGVCGVTATGHEAPPAGGAGPSAVSYCEIALDCDFLWFARQAFDVQATVAAASTLLVLVNGIYQVDVDIRFVITAVIVRTAPLYTTGPDLGCGATPGLLQEFRAYWLANHRDIGRDLAHLLTGEGTFSGTVGCASVGVVCDTLGFGASRVISPNLFRNLQLVAHEIGHNWGATHCDSRPPCNIMCSSLGGCSGVPVTFSQGERTQILAHKATRTCLGTPTMFLPHPDVYYRLSTDSAPSLALSVLTQGNNDRMAMVPSVPFSGQYWRFSPISGSPGRHRISSQFRGLGMPMDVVDGGVENNYAILTPLSASAGQSWFFTEIPEFPGRVSLSADLRGENLALNGAAGTPNNQPVLQNFGPAAGQSWLLTPLFSVDPAMATSFGAACRGRGGVPALQATGGSAPWLNATFTGEVTNVLAGTFANLLLGTRLATPIDLGFVNSPGCLLTVDQAVQVPLPVAAGRATFGLPVPASLPLVGQTLSLQAAVVDPNRGVSDPLIAMTNGLDLRFGLR